MHSHCVVREPLQYLQGDPVEKPMTNTSLTTRDGTGSGPALWHSPEGARARGAGRRGGARPSAAGYALS